MQSKDAIIVRGARENNLKNIDVEVPRGKLVVFTGLSGSGKSSLAFETIYAEGQRRYVESLSSYARQFLGQMEKPDVDSIENLSPAISIDQKTTSKNPRSTVGTITEIYDYLRLLYANIGLPHCPVCGKEIRQQSIDQIVDRILAVGDGVRAQILAPVVRGRKGEYHKLLEDARKSGFVRVIVDGILYDLGEPIPMDKNKKHNIDVVVDRIVIREESRSRIADSAETASKLAGGLVALGIVDGERILFSQKYACPDHDVTIEELVPRLFSFNNPYGACPECTGLGTLLKVDPDLIIPDRNLSLNEGAVKASGWTMNGASTIAAMYFKALGDAYGFDLDTPVRDIPPQGLDALLYGTGNKKLKIERVFGGHSTFYETPFEGIVHNLERRHKETQSDASRADLENFMSAVPCPGCSGRRLNKMALAVTVGGKNIYELTTLPISGLLRFFEELTLSEKEQMIAKQILKEIRERLGFLVSVGLEYLSLSRSAGTLSGGESQRIRLATQIGSSLMGVIYILDEPSIGLHQKDNQKLLATLEKLRDLGNTLIVVEHDEDTMRAADEIVDIGPGAGIHGGYVVAQGSVEDIIRCEDSITGQYLSGKKFIPVPKKRREGNGHKLIVRGARENNLRNIDVELPLGTFICVTGVSGSGKLSLVGEIISKSLAVELNGAVKVRPGRFDRMEGLEHLDKVINIDQSPIGRSPRSNPATYTGLFTDIRDLFASLPESKMRGFGPGRFSFNVKGGRCEACEGDGILKIEMHFLPDIYVPCEVCKGKRYNRETLEVKYKGKSISDVLEMTVEEGLTFFENHPRLKRKLQTLYDVGLGYIKIGQPSTTLSGGEAQRVKLATELSKRSTGRTIYILDEPTTGLHAGDVHKLTEVLARFVDAGNTVLVIEHNLDIIKIADHIIDLGPDGGDRGGRIVVSGTPEQVAACPRSYTGQFLKPLLEAAQAQTAQPQKTKPGKTAKRK